MLVACMCQRAAPRSQYEVVGSDLETLVERGDAKDDRGHAVAATSNGRGSGGSSDDAPKPPPRLLTWQGMVEDCVSSGLIRCMLFDLSAIKDNRDTLRSMAELGSLMVGELVGWVYHAGRVGGWVDHGEWGVGERAGGQSGKWVGR
eukprot:364183-Chlamydomonas_euryale.AAC.22